MSDELTPAPNDEVEQQVAAQEAGRSAGEPAAVGSQALADALRIGFLFLKLVIVAVVVLYLRQCFETVGQDEVRFKLRFGRLVRTRDEWILRRETFYLRWPWEQMVSVPVHERAEDLTEAFWTGDKDGKLRTERTLDVKRDGYVLTGDLNIVHLKLRVRFRASEDLGGARAYAFGVDQPEEILKRALRAATCKVVGSMGVMEVLRQQGLFTGIEKELRARVRAFEQRSGTPLGIDPDSLRVEGLEGERAKNPTEPGAVSREFAAAQNAQNTRNRLVEEGKTDALDITNLAEARRKEIIGAARAYKERLVRGAETDADQLEKLRSAYEAAESKQVFLAFHYMNAIEEVLRRSNSPMVLYARDDGGQELRLQLTRPPSGRRPGAGSGPAAENQGATGPE